MSNTQEIIRPLWIEVDLRALRKNFKAIKKYLGRGVAIVATVKQSAYGHGLVPVARELACQGADFLGVGSIEEAISLRENGFKEPIITLTSVLSRFAGYFLEYDVRPTIVDLKFARELNKQAHRRGVVVPVHVKIDTGMGRLGLYYKQASAFIEELCKLKNLYREGIYTHFPVADSDPEFTNYQIEGFNDFITALGNKNIIFKFCHCANSIGILQYPNAHFNMVRPGLILYGIKPFFNADIAVEPILSLKSKVVFVKQISKGMGVSYGRTYVAGGPRYIATVAAGYADGYPWVLSNRSRVIIDNKFFNIAGRVCMDHIMIDLKNRKDIKAGKDVILIGKTKDLSVSAQDLAQLANTIPYEITSRLSLKIPRIYKG